MRGVEEMLARGSPAQCAQGAQEPQSGGILVFGAGGVHLALSRAGGRILEVTGELGKKWPYVLQGDPCPHSPSSHAPTESAVAPTSGSPCDRGEDLAAVWWESSPPRWPPHSTRGQTPYQVHAGTCWPLASLSLKECSLSSTHLRSITSPSP